MNRRGEASIIFLVVLSVLSACAAGILAFFFLNEIEARKGFELRVFELQTMHAKLQGDFQEMQKQLQLADEKLKEAEGTIENLESEVHVEQGLTEDLKKQNKELRDTLVQEKQANERLREQLNKARATEPRVPSKVSRQVSFDIGRIWYVQEGIWTCQWTRRGKSDWFDAVARNPSGVTFSYEVKFESADNGIVLLYRTDTNGYYRGQITSDQNEIVNGTGDWFVPGDRWSATIER